MADKLIGVLAKEIVYLVNREYPHDIDPGEIVKVYKKFQHKLQIHKLSPRIMLAVILVHRLRETGQSRTLFEMSHIIGVQANDLSRAYRHLIRNTDLQPVYPKISEFVERYCLKMGLPENVTVKAMSITKKVSTGLELGDNPQKIAPALIYLACKKAKHEVKRNFILENTYTTQPTMRRYVKVYEDVV